ncbi:MAG: hypothetical protein OEY14_18415 [Myxococcales bacterium]|nr:hypothetical protein [Myxococcales bacterium]
MSGEFEISLAELLALMGERRIRLPAEVGAFLALTICEAAIERPVALEAEGVRLLREGRIALESGVGASDAEAATSLMALLARILLAAKTEVPRPFLELAERGPRGGLGLARFRDALEASLLPLNREAARRVLSRHLREVLRASPRTERADPSHEVDDELDVWLGLEPRPPSRPPPRFAPPAPSAPTLGAAARPSARAPSLEGIEERPRGRMTRWVLLLLLLLALGAAASVHLRGM